MLKYCDYNDYDLEDNQQITNKQPTDNQQITTNKKDKKEKTVKKDKKDIAFEAPKSLNTEAFKESFAAFIRNRADLKKPMTDEAIRRMLLTLDKMGLEKALVALDLSIQNGWAGVFVPKAADMESAKQDVRKPHISEL